MRRLARRVLPLQQAPRGCGQTSLRERAAAAVAEARLSVFKIQRERVRRW